MLTPETDTQGSIDGNLSFVSWNIKGHAVKRRCVIARLKSLKADLKQVGFLRSSNLLSHIKP